MHNKNAASISRICERSNQLAAKTSIKIKIWEIKSRFLKSQSATDKPEIFSYIKHQSVSAYKNMSLNGRKRSVAQRQEFNCFTLMFSLGAKTKLFILMRLNMAAD